MNKYTLFTSVFVASVALDQVTKYWVRENITYGDRYDEIQIIDGFFSLVHTQNRGAAFGIMEGQMLFFAVFTLIALVFIVYSLWSMDEDDTYQNIALSLIGSGAVGNAIDRVHKQAVTDFLRIYTESPTLKPWLLENFGMAEWPSFNVADAAIVVGMIMFFVHGIFFEEDVLSDEDDDIEAPKLLEEDL